MIVLAKMKTGENKKLMIRNQVFHEINEINKKVAAINTAMIQSIFWPGKEDMGQIPTKEWLTLAEDNNFWGLVE